MWIHRQRKLNCLNIKQGDSTYYGVWCIGSLLCCLDCTFRHTSVIKSNFWACTLYCAEIWWVLHTVLYYIGDIICAGIRPVQTILGYWVSCITLPFNNQYLSVLLIPFQFTPPSISSDSVSVFFTLCILDIKTYNFYFFLHWHHVIH